MRYEEPVLANLLTRIIRDVIIAVVLIWILTGIFYTVPAGSEGVVLTFGKAGIC